MLGCSKGMPSPDLRSTAGHLLLVTLGASVQAGIGTQPYPGSLDPQPGSLDPRPTLLRSGAAAY
jgi:hypothetical protein